MQLEITLEAQVQRVDFQADPRRFPLPPAVGEDPTRPRCVVRHARLRAQVAPGLGEGGGKACVQGMPAQPEGGRRQLLEARGLPVNEPGDFAMVQGIGQDRPELQARYRGGGKTGDEFAANAVPGVGAGLMKRDRHACPAQCEAERQPGQSAPDDFNGLQGIHERPRRTATIR